MFEISEEAKIEFYKSLNKTEKTIAEDVEIIKDWLRNQPHLPEIMVDTQIRNFLNMNKFSIEKTKQKIDMYYTVRAIIPEFFVNPKFLMEKKEIDAFDYASIPKLHKNMHRITYMGCNTENGAFLQTNSIFALFFALFEIRLMDDFITDEILVVDWKHSNLDTVKKFTPLALQKWHTVFEKVYSLRLHKLVYINSPSIATIFISILKKVLKPKLFERVIVCKDDSILKELFSDDEIPSDYGGKCDSIENMKEQINQRIIKHQDRFDVLDTLKVDESLRPEKLNNDEILGYYGHFKKFDLD